MALMGARSGLNGELIQDPSDFTLTDASASPKTSPVTAGTSEIALVLPSNSKAVVIRAVSADVRIGLVTGCAVYWTLYSGGSQRITRPPGSTVYVARPTSTAVEFLFELFS